MRLSYGQVANHNAFDSPLIRGADSGPSGTAGSAMSSLQDFFSVSVLRLCDIKIKQRRRFDSPLAGAHDRFQPFFPKQLRLPRGLFGVPKPTDQHPVEWFRWILFDEGIEPFFLHLFD